MGILTRFTLRTLSKSRARTIVSVIGIALSCALITAIFTTITSIEGGIIQHELETSGTWETSFAGLSANALTRLENDERATDVAVSYELGSALLKTEKVNASDGSEATETEDGNLEAYKPTTATTYPSYLTVKTLPQTTKGTQDAWATKGTGATALAMLPALSEGSLPTSQDEIALPLSLKGEEQLGNGISCEGAIKLGSQVTLSLGRRVRTETSGAQSRQSCANVAAQLEFDGSTEELADVIERTYTVTGFITGASYGYSGELMSSAAGSVAITAAADAQGAGDGAAILAFVTTSIPTYDQIKSWDDEICGATNYNGTGTPSVAVTHDNLLRYQGRTDGRAIWITLWQVAAILCGVVMAASVSLIYTSFAISVTERTRQLGLLSGIGASKRQLRQSVLMEALILGGVGIPAGILLGIAGTAATLAAMSEEFSSMLETSGSVALALDWRVLLLAAGLSLVTLLVSAFIPAVKASRASAVDAMRQAGSVRIRAHRGRIGGRVAQALFGVPGLVAHRNLTRSGSRSRVVVASLAVSVVLVVTCGCLNAYMQPLMGAAANSSYPQGTDAVVSASGSDDVTQAFAELRGQVDGIEGVGEAGAHLSTSVAARIPASMVSADTSSYLAQNEGALMASPGQLVGDAAASDEKRLSNVADDGSVACDLSVYYLDDPDWRAYVSQLGLSEDEYCDAANPRGIAINSYITSDGSRYVTTGGLASAGTITLYGTELPGADEQSDLSFYGVFTTPEGQVKLTYACPDENCGTVLKTFDASEASCTQALEVGAVTTETPSCLSGFGINYAFPQVILPASAIGSAAGVADGTAAGKSLLTAQVGTLCLSVDESTRAASQLEDTVSAYAEKNPDLGFYVNNLSESAKSSLNAARLIQLLIVLFSVITMLIALANVFNTLTNSIILRTREFAMLRSCGMGDAAFAKMMLYECASYALRGLAIGLVLAAGVSWLMWDSMTLSFNGMGLAMPLPYILLACAGAAVVLAVSAAYALWRSHAQNLVEALRCDAL